MGGLTVPPGIAGLHPVIGAWHRQGPWTRGSVRNSYQAIYAISPGGVLFRRLLTIDARVVHDFVAVRWALEHGGRGFSRTTRAVGKSRSAATGTAEPVGP